MNCFFGHAYRSTGERVKASYRKGARERFMVEGELGICPNCRTLFLHIRAFNNWVELEPTIGRVDA